MKCKKRNPKIDKAISFLMMNLGIILLTAGVYFFKMPNGFATGGVSGIGIILGKLTRITSGQWIFAINALLLLLGFIFLGRQTGIKTVYCSLLFSGYIRLLEKVFPLNAPFTSDPLLELVYAMLLTSVGSALIFNSQASSGGTDIAALILKKYTKIDVGKALFAVDFIIALSSFFIFGTVTGLYSMLGLFMKAFLVDIVIDSLHSCKYFIAITEKPEEVSEYVLNTLHHGVTTNTVVGQFSGRQKMMIHTVCRRIEAIRLRGKIKEIDPHAFIIITTTSEIIGRGFRDV